MDDSKNEKEERGITKDNSERMKTNKKFLQSYLFTNYGKFFISTIYRRSSVMLEIDSWYYETFAWKLDKDNHRTDWVADNSGAGTVLGAFEQHIEVCRQLELNGEYKEVA